MIFVAGRAILDRRIKFTEKFVDEEYSTTTFYFKAPKELLADKEPAAEAFLLSVEFDTDHPEAKHASVEFSPLIKGEIVGWWDMDLPLDEIEQLISLGIAAQKDVNKKPSVDVQIQGAASRAVSLSDKSLKKGFTPER